MKNNKSFYVSYQSHLEAADGFLPHAKKRSYTKRTLLFSHGDVIRSVRIILSGWVKVSTETLDGKEAIVDILTSGDILGERAILNLQEQKFSAEVISSQATFIEIPVHAIKESMINNTEVGFYFLSSLIVHVQSLRTHIEHLSYSTAIQRLSCFLLSFHASEGKEFELPCSKTQIATYLCMERETLSRALTQLRKQGCIKIEDSYVTILDEEKLSAHNPMLEEEEPQFANENNFIDAIQQLMKSEEPLRVSQKH
jgi:CRP/FNR family transcriptional regulator